MMRAAGFWILAALGLGAPLGDRLAAALHDQRFAAVGLGLLISALALAPSDGEGRETLRALLSTLLGALLIQVVPLPLGDGWDDVLALGTFTGIGALFFALGIAPTSAAVAAPSRSITGSAKYSGHCAYRIRGAVK